MTSDSPSYRRSPRGAAQRSPLKPSSGKRGAPAACLAFVAAVVLLNVLPRTSVFYQGLPPPHVIRPGSGKDHAAPAGQEKRMTAGGMELALADEARPAPLGACPEPVTPYSVDCHILQSKRADPYSLRRQAESGMAPDPELDKCDDLPGYKQWSYPVLNNLEVAEHKDEDPPREGLRVMCMILTYSKKHDNNLEAVRATWGRRCHGFVAFSNQTDPLVSAVATPVYGGERYTNTWQKMRSLWKYTWFHYSGEFDWFLKADDDTYIVWDNLMEFLGSGELQAELAAGGGVYLGRRFAMTGTKSNNYTSGGAGYVLDRAALGKLVHNLDHSDCDPTGQHQFEDYWAGRCLRKGGVAPRDTRDSLGRQRFNPFQPWNHYQYKGNDWYEKYSLEPLKFKIECCSRRSVSFHYQPRKEMLQTHRYLYNCRKKEDLTNL